MAVDYLKNYLNIDPNDYSAMQSRIAGTPVVDDQFARIDSSPSVNSLRNFGMPQQRSLGDISAMPMMPRRQPVQQDDSKYDGLMAEIASLKAQIEGMQAPVVEEAPVMAPTPAVVEAPAPTPAPAVISEPYQAPVGIENRMVGEPEPFVAQELVPAPTPALDIPQARAEDIQASIDYLAKLPKMNIPQIPDMEEIKQKMAEAGMSFPEPVSYQDQLQSIADLPKITQMPTREEIQIAMQNIPTPIAPVSSMPKFSLPQTQSFGLPQKIGGGRTLMSDFSPRNVMRMASGGGIDKAIYDLKFKLNGS